MEMAVFVQRLCLNLINCGESRKLNFSCFQSQYYLYFKYHLKGKTVYTTVQYKSTENVFLYLHIFNALHINVL